MKRWHRYTLTIVLGLAAGVSFAVSRVRGGLAAGQVTNGPWATAKTYGSTDADALTRARVALSGLLALPAKEAMYFTAKADSAGRPLDGKCSYEVFGSAIPARWWSLTVYDAHGRLRSNRYGRYSITSADERVVFEADLKDPSRTALWFFLDPEGIDEHYTALPTGGSGAIELTLRVYHPSQTIISDPRRVKLPVIQLNGCA